MAFTTEFVMGAGGTVEEIPFSVPQVGRNATVVLTTVTPPSGGSVLIAVHGTTSGTVSGSMQVGASTASPQSGATGIAATATAPVEVKVVGGNAIGTNFSFSGTVYVARL